MKEDYSQPRNPILTRIFRAINLAENAGSGFDKMFKGWKSYYSKKPVVSGDINYYKITFPTTQKTTLKTTQKTTHKIIKLIKANPKITRKELSNTIELTENGIKYQLKK